MTELTQENFLIYAGRSIEHILLISDMHERAERFTDIMDRARELGKADEVEDLAQKIATDFNGPELWELPQSFEKEVKLIDFPVSCLPIQLQEYLKAVASYVQVFPEMAALPLLSVLALCVQGKAVVKNPGNSHTENLNLYTMTIASPGERKTGCFKEFMKPVKSYQDNYNEIHRYEVQEYQTKKNFLESQKNAAMKGKNANLERAKELTKELVDLKAVYELRLNVSDATPEALAWEMYLQGGKIGVLGDEGAIFDVLSGMYSGGTANLNIFLEAYDGSDYSIIRRTKENIDLKNPLLTIGLMVQPDLFIQTMDNRTFSGRGFIYRFLFSFPDSKVGYQTLRSENIPQNLQAVYIELINKLLRMPTPESPAILLSDKEAYQIFEDYHNHLQESMRKGSVFENLREWASKQFARCLKIAGILHLCEHEATDQINGQTALNAVSIAIWTENHALKALSAEMLNTEEKRNAAYILSRIKALDKLELSKREIKRLCKAIKEDQKFDEPLELLEDMKCIKQIQTIPNNGRPSIKYKINPLIKEF